MNNEKYLSATVSLLISILFIMLINNSTITFLAGITLSVAIIHLYLTYVDNKLLYETKISRCIMLLKYQFVAEIVTLIFTYKSFTPAKNLAIIGMLTGTLLMIALIQLKRRVGN